MNVYKVTSRCTTDGVVCTNFRMDIETYTEEEALAEFSDWDPTSNYAVEEHETECFYFIGTARQIWHSYDAGSWYSLEGDENEIQAAEKEFTEALMALEFED